MNEVTLNYYQGCNQEDTSDQEDTSELQWDYKGETGVSIKFHTKT